MGPQVIPKGRARTRGTAASKFAASWWTGKHARRSIESVGLVAAVRLKPQPFKATLRTSTTPSHNLLGELGGQDVDLFYGGGLRE